MLGTLHHIGIYCDNLEATVDAYRALGAAEIARSTVQGNATTRIAWMKMADGTVYELVHAPEVPSASRHQMNHVAYSSNNADDIASALRTAHMELEDEPQDVVLEFNQPIDQLEGLFPPTTADAVKLRVAFFRGIAGERFEIAQGPSEDIDTSGMQQ